MSKEQLDEFQDKKLMYAQKWGVMMTMAFMIMQLIDRTKDKVYPWYIEGLHWFLSLAMILCIVL